MTCSLCGSEVGESFSGTEGIKLHRCSNCWLVFKDPELHPSAEEEEYRYAQHNNSDDCPGYRDFLNQALAPTLPYLDFGMEGLDFGCGPNPVLARMLDEAGYSCTYYDPFFFPDLPDDRQDFIMATECFEHFFAPAAEMKLLTALLRPHGTLTVMTHRWDEETDFSTWWYLRDPTHVSFFHRKTFDYLCSRFGYQVEEVASDKVIVLRKMVVV